MKFFIILLLPIFINASSLELLIENAKASHLSLTAIEHKLNSVDDEYEITKNFSNPVLSLSISDIQLGDISNRSIEPMQFTALNFKQKIPYFGKRYANGKKVLAKKYKVYMTLQEAKVTLVREIKLSAYAIWEVEQQLKINDEYLDLINQNIELYDAYNISSTSAHMGLMSAELTLSQLKIKKSKLSAILESLYKKISYLSNLNVTQINLDMQIKEPKSIYYYLDYISSNKTYKIKEASIKVANADIAIKRLDKNIDPSLQVGYYYRDNFKDYVNIGVSFSLPIYGTENSKEQISRKMALSYKSEAIDFKNQLNSRIFDMHENLKDSYRIYNIINKESLPQIEHMTDLSSTSVKNGAELFVYTYILEKQLILNEQSINSVAAYYKSIANLDALIGEMK
ncbi:MAG: TolC family protein [Sulfurimonas sp.]|nr:TolC family protein [Sulfurimonas sp.]